MKTININLIGDTGKSIKKTVKVSREGIDNRVKIISISAIAGSSLIFVICLLTWTGAFLFTKKLDSDLKKLKTEHQKIGMELAKSSKEMKNLSQEKKIMETKLLVKKQLDTNTMPWHKILADISAMVPKDVKITKIMKLTGDSDKNTTINIEGTIDAAISKTASPLELVSYFAINISENKADDFYLKEAVIKMVEFDDKNNIYNFRIQTSLKMPREENTEKEGV